MREMLKSFVTWGHLLAGGAFTLSFIVIPFCTWIVSAEFATDARLDTLVKTQADGELRLHEAINQIEKTQSDSDIRTRDAIAALDARLQNSNTELLTGIRRLDDKFSALLLQGWRPVYPIIPNAPVVVPHEASRPTHH